MKNHSLKVLNGKLKKTYTEKDIREAFKQGHSSARKGSYNEITEQEDFDKWFKNK